MVEVMRDGDGELVGVDVRNTFYIKVYGLTEEEYNETYSIMRDLFDRKGYKYIQEANRVFRRILSDLDKKNLVAENEKLKAELENNKSVSETKVRPGTIGK